MLRKILLSLTFLLFAAVAANAKTVIIRNDYGGDVQAYNARLAQYTRNHDHVVIDQACMSACARFMIVPNACATNAAYFYFHAISDDRGHVLPRASLLDSQRTDNPTALALEKKYNTFTFGLMNTRPAASVYMEDGVDIIYLSQSGPDSSRPPFYKLLRVKGTKILPLCH